MTLFDINRRMAATCRDWPAEREVVLSGHVGENITPRGVHDALSAPGPVRIVLNSPGGDHAAALAIYHAIRARPGVQIHVALAASAAALLAVAADWRTIAAGGRMMVHRSAAVAAGTAADLRRAADGLAATDDRMLAILAERTGCADLAARVDGDLWLDASEALALGFVHAIELPDAIVSQSPADPVRAALVRQENALRRRLGRLTDETQAATTVAARRAAATVDAAYAAGVEALDAEFSALLERDGLATLEARADESLRRLADATVQALRHVRRQLRAHNMGGVPATAPALSTWTCATCGQPNFHNPGDPSRLADCFTCTARNEP